jgi:hypothetical protein
METPKNSVTFLRNHKISPPNAHVPRTRPSILVWSEQNIHEQGNIYIDQYIRNN